MIDYEKLKSWVWIQLEDIQMIYDAMGNDRAYGAIKAYESLIAQIKLLQAIDND